MCWTCSNRRTILTISPIPAAPPFHPMTPPAGHWPIRWASNSTASPMPSTVPSNAFLTASSKRQPRSPQKMAGWMPAATLPMSLSTTSCEQVNPFTAALRTAISMSPVTTPRTQSKLPLPASHSGTPTADLCPPAGSGGLEQYHFPVTVIYGRDIDSGNLRSKYDVIVFVDGAIPRSPRRASPPGATGPNLMPTASPPNIARTWDASRHYTRSLNWKNS
jgi:hypothetical protein